MDKTRLTQKQFDGLLDYSCSLPTGQVVGKRWKRRKNYHDESKGWFIGEYVHGDEPGFIGIRWTEPHILNEVETVIAGRLYD